MMTIFRNGIKIAHMGKQKEMMMNILEKKFWERPWLDMVSDFQDQYLDLDEEVFEVTKGNIKTTITYKFNKKGYPVASKHESETILSDDEKIQRQIDDAVKDKNYSLAAELQAKLTNK